MCSAKMLERRIQRWTVDCNSGAEGAATNERFLIPTVLLLINYDHFDRGYYGGSKE
jgi:hypothetical protein